MGSRSSERGDDVNSDDDDDLYEVLGPYGHGELNEAGKELLSFLSINEASVCNTWFQKKGIHKATWQHPGSKKWHCIDYAIMKQSQRRKCLDVSVMRGAQCNTDHQMLRVKLRVEPGRRRYRPSANRPHKKFDISKLKEQAADRCGKTAAKEHFQEMVGEKLNVLWKETDSIEQKWTSMKSALCEAAEATIGREKRRQTDWFREGAPAIRPLLQKRNTAYNKWLSTGNASDKEKFKKARKEAQKAIREAKNNWFSRKATEAQGGINGGKVVWKCIREIQRGKRGLVPMRTANVRDEEGRTCSTPQQQHDRWRRHFTNLLNIVSQIDESELSRARQQPPHPEMAHPPSADELERAVTKLRNGKAAGQSEILPEMLKAACCNAGFFNHLLELVTSIWNEQRVPQDWVDAILIPIPKKGDLRSCDNWRGIALLDVVGKAVATILQERLQTLAEQELPESQCGFRKERSCTDMIFVIRQLVEKSWEHKSKSFFTFVDLKKAYDSVPRKGMWLALKKLGVPEKAVNLIEAFHSNMKAKIRMDGELLEDIRVENGLRQGCCMAPVLFNLYTTLAIERWQDRVAGNEGVGITLRFKMDEKLFRRYTKNASEQKISECLFADDGALLASSRSGAEAAAIAYQETSRKFGLTVNINKTKHMVVGREATTSDEEPLPMQGGNIESVEQFPYLGSVVAASGKIDADVDRRITQASSAFGALRKSVFLDRDLSLVTKRKVYQACVLSVLLYGSECWTLLKRHSRKLDVFHHRCIRIVLGVSSHVQWTSCITSDQLRQKWGDMETITMKIAKRRLQWLGHLARMPDSRVPKKLSLDGSANHDRDAAQRRDGET